MTKTIAGLSALLIMSAVVQAEVKQVAIDGFHGEQTTASSATVERSFEALAEVDEWWHPDHTWSGSSTNLSLELELGACFCERWPNHAVEHLRVVRVDRNEMLRLRGGLGPLQGMGLSGLFEWTVVAREGGSTIKMSYRVIGDSLSGLDKLAPVVDEVLALQIGRLRRYLDTGVPEEPVAAKAAASLPRE